MKILSNLTEPLKYENTVTPTGLTIAHAQWINDGFLSLNGNTTSNYIVGNNFYVDPTIGYNNFIQSGNTYKTEYGVSNTNYYWAGVTKLDGNLYTGIEFSEGYYNLYNSNTLVHEVYSTNTEAFQRLSYNKLGGAQYSFLFGNIDNSNVHTIGLNTPNIQIGFNDGTYQSTSININNNSIFTYTNQSGGNILRINNINDEAIIFLNNSAITTTSLAIYNECDLIRDTINNIQNIKLGWNLVNTTGNTISYSEVIVPIVNMLDGIYNIKVTGTWKVELTSGNVFQEYVTYNLFGSCRINGGTFTYIDNSGYNYVMGPGFGNVSLNGFTAGLALDFISMTVYDNTYTTTHNAIIELLYIS